MDGMIRIGIAQINCTVGDLKGNGKKIVEYARKACDSGVDIVAFPELTVTGYPPEDLLLKPQFVTDNLAALGEAAEQIGKIVAVVGFVDRKGSQIFNGAAVIQNGKVRAVYHKMLLPNYGVFDEKRYFYKGSKPLIVQYGPVRFGVNICEDIWFDEGPTLSQAERGARLIININASPFHAGKMKVRERVVRKQARSGGVFLCYANLVGGQDELVFDGRSFIVDSDGQVIGRASAFSEDLLMVDIPREDLTVPGYGRTVDVDDGETNLVRIPGKPEAVHEREKISGRRVKSLRPVQEVYEALVLGLRDYVTKNGFRRIVLGLSGGIDSALVAALAADALGKENVLCVFMPSRYTSVESEEDSRDLAANLGVEMMTIPIDPICQSYFEAFDIIFAGMKQDTTEENIQARIRGNLLMAISNKFGWLVLTTGNKSEMSVGYATLYGDMAGGFAVIKDVPKTLVYSLCRYRNSITAVIPERIITKEPSAELKPDQKDTDYLPPYEFLDGVLRSYVEEDKSAGAIIASGREASTVDRVIRMVEVSEYKRRQSPPGIKITPKAFGRDRRMPITNKYRG